MEKLEEKAREIRKELLDLSVSLKETHLGGSLSEVEILVSLFCNILKDEDKFILSKGHCCHPMYLLLQEKGYYPKIITHPDIDEKNKIFCTTGSLGHGLPIGVGMALARKKQGKSGKIFVLVGDGECQEGTTWESALIASHHNLDNLVVIVDRNKLQALGDTEKILALGDLKEKFSVFGWFASDVEGHSIQALLSELNKSEKNKPRILIAHTIKGKGISYMENKYQWHTRVPTEDELKQAYLELR